MDVNCDERKPLICLRDLSNYRERNMPSSPIEVKSHGGWSPGQPSPSSGSNRYRPQSNGSSISGVTHELNSPTSSPEAPSPPPALTGSTTAQQLPPACGARQLSKLKRFLTTLIQFGTDISIDIGDRVRSLVLALVNNHLSVEEFHSKLQEGTNFPLRPFVIPFLKANLPLLQRELFHCAQMARQSPQQYLLHNEHLLLNPGQRSALPPTSCPPSLFRSTPQPDLGVGGTVELINQNGKRQRTSPPTRLKENGCETSCDSQPPPAKRTYSLSPHSQHSPVVPVTPSEPRPREPRDEEADRNCFFTHYGVRSSDNQDSRLDRIEEEWKHLENMLHCIMDMVGRCRQALTAVQDRVRMEREDVARWVRHSGVDPDVKKKADYVTESLQNAEDRVTDIRRRAVHVFPEEAVNEVKRQALLELQKAVAAAEQKASELVAAERRKMDRAMNEARSQAREEINKVLLNQVESIETCWNCGRKASETCSGCNMARYCGAFCQHKDWERHHRQCRRSPQPSSPQDTPPQATADRVSSSSPHEERQQMAISLSSLIKVEDLKD